MWVCRAWQAHMQVLLSSTESQNHPRPINNTSLLPVLVLEVSSDHLVEGFMKDGCSVTVKRT